jgi:hypothetical protein
MIRKNYRTCKTVVECDNCENEIELDTNNYEKVSEIIRCLHWKIDKVKDNYIHFCPKCATKEVFTS